MNDALEHPKLIDQAADCGYFWKESEKVHSALSIIERHASILQVATDCKNQGRKSDDKQPFVNSYFVSISNGIELKKKSVNKITKDLSLPRSTYETLLLANQKFHLILQLVFYILGNQYRFLKHISSLVS